MSTKSKRRSSRRAHQEQSPASRERPTPDGKVAGEIMGALLNAITLGALEGPASGKSDRKTPPDDSTSAPR
jgi:hypothetical protein